MPRGRNHNKMENFWDQRYREPEFAYGKEPNAFFLEQILLLPKGKILLPAEGEGRNAVFAAENGWIVTAFDCSSAAMGKALHLAESQNVTIEYQVSDFENARYENNSFDCLAFIFTHFSKEKQQAYFDRMFHFLKPGGTVIVEVFSTDNLALRKANPGIGGPVDPGMLFRPEEMAFIFRDFDKKILQQVRTELHEGLFHNGTASVIRVVATKKQ